MNALDVAARPRLGASYRKVFAASAISNLGDGVSLIGYPWLASAVTRNPLLIALVAVAQRSLGSCSRCRRVSSPIASTAVAP